MIYSPPACWRGWGGCQTAKTCRGSGGSPSRQERNCAALERDLYLHAPYAGRYASVVLWAGREDCQGHHRHVVGWAVGVGEKGPRQQVVGDAPCRAVFGP